MAATITLRLVLTMVLLFFVYGETGPATTFALALLSLANEATSYWIHHTQKAIKLLLKI